MAKRKTVQRLQERARHEQAERERDSEERSRRNDLENALETFRKWQPTVNTNWREGQPIPDSYWLLRGTQLVKLCSALKACGYGDKLSQLEPNDCDTRTLAVDVYRLAVARKSRKAGELLKTLHAELAPSAAYIEFQDWLRLWLPQEIMRRGSSARPTHKVEGGKANARHEQAEPKTIDLPSSESFADTEKPYVSARELAECGLPVGAKALLKTYSKEWGPPDIKGGGAAPHRWSLPRIQNKLKGQFTDPESRKGIDDLLITTQVTSTSNP